MGLLLKNVLFTLLVPGTVAGYVPYRLTRGEEATTHPLGLVIAGVLFALGTAGYLWCLVHFAVEGRGTPAPIDAPKRLVVGGLHRYVRNPMYLSVLTVIAGWAVLYRSSDVAVYGGITALVVHAMVVLYEEPTLERLFGEDYRAYRRSVRRWLPRPRSPRA